MTSLRPSDLAASRFPLLLAAALLVAACGGSSPDPATPGGGGGGGTTTATSRGVVTAVGALTVNGIAFDASTAQIRIDDNPGRPSPSSRSAWWSL